MRLWHSNFGPSLASLNVIILTLLLLQANAAPSDESISASHVEDDGGSTHLMETSTVKVPPMETTTTQEPQHQGPTEQPQQQPQQQQQMRKDLNELPEMRKAKELRAEGEKAEIEADTLREMARLEEELKKAEAQKEEEAAHAKPGGEGEASGNPEEAANLKSHESEQISPSNVTETALISFMQDHQPESVGVDHQVEESPEGSHEKEEEEPMPAEGSGHPMEAIGMEKETAEEGKSPELPMHHGEALETTQKSSSSAAPPAGHEAADEETASGAVDDPFQTSSTPASKMEETGEKETVKETVHVHQQQPSAEQQGGGGGSGGGGGEGAAEHGHNGGEDASKEEAPKTVEEEPKEAESETEHKLEEELPMQHDGREEGSEEKKQNETSHSPASPMMKPIEAKEDDEVSHESSTMAPLPTVNEESPRDEKPEEGEHKESMANSSEQRKTVEEGEKSAAPETKEEEAEQEPPQPAIVFPAPHQQQSTTTEESAVIAGDKSVFDRTQEEAEKMPGPEQAHIQHMSHEGEHEKSKSQEDKHESVEEATTHLPPPQAGIAGLVPEHSEAEESKEPEAHPKEANEGSSGFELITKDVADSPAPSAPSGTEKPEEAKETAEEEQVEVMPTPAEEETKEPPTPESEVAPADHTTHMPPPPMMMSTSTMGSSNNNNSSPSLVDEADAGHSEGEMAHAEGSEEATTMVGMAQTAAAAEEADTPPQRGDLPGVETASSPMEAEQTTMMPMTTMMMGGGDGHGMEETEEHKEEHGEHGGMEKEGGGDENAVTEGHEGTTEMNGMSMGMGSSTMSPEQLELALAKAFRTPFSVRFPDIEWRSEFEDIDSGVAKKLREQIEADLKSALSTALGPTNKLLDFQVTAMRKGSVILEGEMQTTEEVVEPQGTVSALEQAILAKNGELGGNLVDTDQLNVAGQMPSGASSNNNLLASEQQKQQQQDAATNTGLIIGGAVVVGVLIVVFAIFAIIVFGLNTRRNNCGTMKLSSGKEEICMVENGKGHYGGRRFLGGGVTRAKGTDGSGQIPNSVDAEAGNGGVNLMSLRTNPSTPAPVYQQNGRNNHTSSNGNGTPILISGGGGTQFSSPTHHHPQHNYGGSNGNGGTPTRH